MTTHDLVTTQRLRLHRPTLHDLAPIHALQSDESSLEETSASLEQWIAHWDEHGFGYWVIRNDAGEFVGIGGIAKDAPVDEKRARLFFRIAPRARRRGYATEVTRAAIDAAFGNLALERVHAIVLPEDIGSIAVAERAGLLAGETLDPSGRVLYTVYREDWEERRG